MTGIATVVKQSAPAQMQRHAPSIARGSNTIDLDSLDIRAAQAGDAAAFDQAPRVTAPSWLALKLIG